MLHSRLVRLSFVDHLNQLLPASVVATHSSETWDALLRVATMSIAPHATPELNYARCVFDELARSGTRSFVTQLRGAGLPAAVTIDVGTRGLTVFGSEVCGGVRAGGMGNASVVAI
jgi:hypothetical protein